MLGKPKGDLVASLRGGKRREEKEVRVEGGGTIFPVQIWPKVGGFPVVGTWVFTNGSEFGFFDRGLVNGEEDSEDASVLVVVFWREERVRRCNGESWWCATMRKIRRGEGEEGF
ncbi:hypothetical protein HAX54_028892 [Datura stramonium]|uniref:Uncharacterized protein n=1 Tax=Datura stramonium TaxID=4076 RepID=A0ABS8V4X3_DATST|nr:hypothetical protein [Datura stramonium]